MRGAKQLLEGQQALAQAYARHVLDRGARSMRRSAVMRRSLAPVFLAVIVGAAAAPVLAVTPHLVVNDNDPYVPCAIGVDLAQQGTTTASPVTTSDGETG